MFHLVSEKNGNVIALVFCYNTCTNVKSLLGPHNEVTSLYFVYVTLYMFESLVSGSLHSPDNSIMYPFVFLPLITAKHC